MQSQYYTHDGYPITTEAIRQAFKLGRARLVHSHGDGKTQTSLSIDGQSWDTRGQCYSKWDESWTTKPIHLGEAIAAAYTR